MQRRWFLRLSALTLLVAVVSAGVLAMSLQHTDLQTLRHHLEHYRLTTTAIRLVGITVIALTWPKLVCASEQCGHISRERSLELKARRWRIVSWLILIELLVGQNLISGVWPAPTGSSA